MKSNQSMTGEELGQMILKGLQQVKAGQFRVAYSPVTAARTKLGMTQEEFAKLLSVSVRTLQGWEQGLKQPAGAARSLIRVAVARPDVVREVLAA